MAEMTAHITPCCHELAARETRAASRRFRCPACGRRGYRASDLIAAEAGPCESCGRDHGDHGHPDGWPAWTDADCLSALEAPRA